MEISRLGRGKQKYNTTAVFSVEGARRASEINGVGTPSPLAKVYSEFGRRCNTRLSHIWYYAPRFGLLLTCSYVRSLCWRAQRFYICFRPYAAGYENNFAARRRFRQEQGNAQTALTYLCYITGVEFGWSRGLINICLLNNIYNVVPHFWKWAQWAYFKGWALWKFVYQYSIPWYDIYQFIYWSRYAIWLIRIEFRFKILIRVWCRAAQNTFEEYLNTYINNFR